MLPLTGTSTYAHTQTLSLSLSFSLSHTYTNTHTRVHTRTYLLKACSFSNSNTHILYSTQRRHPSSNTHMHACTHTWTQPYETIVSPHENRQTFVNPWAVMHGNVNKHIQRDTCKTLCKNCMCVCVCVYMRACVFWNYCVFLCFLTTMICDLFVAWPVMCLVAFGVMEFMIVYAHQIIPQQFVVNMSKQKLSRPLSSFHTLSLNALSSFFSTPLSPVFKRLCLLFYLYIPLPRQPSTSQQERGGGDCWY